MTKKTSPDRAYLIRCWQESAAPSCGAMPCAPRWRFSVEEVLHERKRWGFEDLDALFAFLRAEFFEGGGGDGQECKPQDSPQWKTKIQPAD